MLISTKTRTRGSSPVPSKSCFGRKQPSLARKNQSSRDISLVGEAICLRKLIGEEIERDLAKSDNFSDMEDIETFIRDYNPYKMVNIDAQSDQFIIDMYFTMDCTLIVWTSLSHASRIYSMYSQMELSKQIQSTMSIWSR